MENKQLEVWRKLFAVGFVLGLGFLINVARAQSYLYAAKAYMRERAHEMEPVSVSTDSVLSRVGQWGWGPCLGVASEGDLTFIGNGQLLQVLETSDGGSPRLVGQLLTKGTVFGVVVSGNYAYTISPFQVIDISNPVSPKLVSTYILPTAYPPTTFIVKGNYAYIGDFNGDIYIIDISNPDSPHSVGAMQASGESTAGIAVSGTHLFAVTGDGMHLDDFDISNAESPRLVDRIPFTGIGMSLEVAGHYLYMGITTTEPNFQIFDISNASNPRFAGGMEVSNYPADISVSGRYAYVCLDTAGFEVLDVSNPSSIKPLATIHGPNESANKSEALPGPQDASIASGLAYVSTGTGLWVIDLSELQSLKPLYFYSTGWSVNQIALDSSGDVVVSSDFGINLVDISSPSEPVTIGQYASSEVIGDVVLSSDIAYLLCSRDLILLDLSKPAGPVELSSLQIDSTGGVRNLVAFGTMAVDGDRLYIATARDELLKVDVSNPLRPIIIGKCRLTGNPIDLSVDGGYLYVTEANTGIEIFSTGASAPLQPAASFLVRNIRGTYLHQNRMYVAADSFCVYDISNLLNPHLMGSTVLPGGDITTVSLSLTGDFVYVSYGTSFLVTNVSNPYSPAAVFDTTGSFTWFVEADSNFILLGAGEDGFYIINNDLISPYSPPVVTPILFELSQNYPNPFNPSTTIDYQLPVGGFAVLRVYDILGRRLETLVNDYVSSGAHSVKFNGEDLSSGVYFYRLQVNGCSAIKKMLLLR